MMTFKNKTQKGFTLVETIVAILILVLTIGALLTLTAGGFFTIRYVKNDIVAGNLLQESLEYIRSTRDTTAQAGGSWDGWYRPYVDNGCTKDGCSINPYATTPENRIIVCNGDCPYMVFFPGPNFYAYNGDNTFGPSTDQPYDTSFVRTIKMDIIDQQTSDSAPGVLVSATISWMNGTNRKSTTQSVIFTPWNF